MTLRWHGLRQLYETPFELLIACLTVHAGYLLIVGGNRTDLPDWLIIAVGVTAMVGGAVTALSRLGANVPRLERCGLALILAIYAVTGTVLLVHYGKAGEDAALTDYVVAAACALRIRVLGISLRFTNRLRGAR